ncbi:hypothetical protein [Nostoc sp.]
MQRVLENLANWIFPALIGALLSSIATILVTQEQKKTRYLDYAVNEINIIGSERNIPKDKIKVIFNNNKNPVEEVSQVQFLLYNLSDQDYENVDLYIDISPKSNMIKPLIIIADEIGGSIKDAVENKTRIKPPDNPKGQRFGYRIKNINRSKIERISEKSDLDIPQPIFKITYTIIGNKSDEVQVVPSILAKGISERKLSYDNLFNYKALYQKDWLYLWKSNLYIIYTSSLLLIVLFCIWYERELKNVDFKQKEKKILNAIEKRLHQPGAIDELRHKSLSNEIVDFLVIINNKVSNEWIDKVMSEHLSEELSQTGKIDELKQWEASKIAELLVKIEREFRWASTPWWKRWYSGIPKP